MASLSKADRAALKSYDDKMRLVKDRITGVVRGFATGFYLYGTGGSGKSFGVLDHLDSLDCDYRLFNPHMTDKGLFKALSKAPDSIHLFEEMDSILDHPDAQAVLRSALWAQANKERIVTWITGNEEKTLIFRGGIIIVANRPIGDYAELRSLKQRISVHHLEVTDAEMAAVMRRIAGKGWARYQHSLDAEKALEVCELLIQECRQAQHPLDLRLLEHSCLDFCQWESGQAHLGWHDLVAHRVRQAAIQFRQPPSTLSSEERQAHERDLVREIMKQTSDPQEQVRLWKEQTGKGKSTFYTRQKQLDDPEFNV